MKQKKFRGLTDPQLLKILVEHERAINQQAEAVRWLLKTAGHPAFQEQPEAVEAVDTNTEVFTPAAMDEMSRSIPEAVWADLGRPADPVQP